MAFTFTFTNANANGIYIYIYYLLLIADFLVQFLMVSDPPGGPGKGSLGFESQRTVVSMV